LGDASDGGVAQALPALTVLLRFAPYLTVSLLLAPIAAGLIGTLLPAFGILPSLGGEHLSMEPWRALFATPGLMTSLRVTLSVGFGATLLSLVLAVGFCALASENRAFGALQRGLAPLLAAPHVAMAIGFAFLIAPSGWIARLISPELTGWDRPPALGTARDSLGLSFAVGLVLKETPYLVLMMIGAAGQVATRPMLASARSMGYAPAVAWLKVVFPQIYRQIRLPVYAVLAFSLSVVEVALILAPGTPPPLSVLALRWYTDYDLRLYFPASAAATLQLVIIVAAIALWRVGEIAIARMGRFWVERGIRSGMASGLTVIAGGTAAVSGILGVMSLVTLLIWSLAQEWRFPDSLPSRWTFATWIAQAADITAPLVTTVVIGMGSSLFALVLALACLENEQRRNLHPGSRALWLLYLPLIVPQIAFLFGVQVMLVRWNADATLLAVIWTHLLFVLPYVFLALTDPYRKLDPRYSRIAAALGSSPARTFFTVKLPILLRPVLIALAVGFAVSVGQYLPTLFAGGGRVATLTTEAITLSSGADRRITGIYAALQSLLPLLAYGLALAAPALVFRKRQGLR